AKAYPMATGAGRALPEARGEPQPITEALLVGRGGGFSFGLSGTPITSGPWIDDEHFLQVKGGQLLRIEARTGKSEPFADPEKIKKSLSAIKDVNTSAAERISKVTGFTTNPDQASLFVPPPLRPTFL